MLDTWPPSSPFPASLIADPAKEAMEKLSIDLLETINQILFNISTISRITRSAKGFGTVDLCISLTEYSGLLPNQGDPESWADTAFAGAAVDRGLLLH